MGYSPIPLIYHNTFLGVTEDNGSCSDEESADENVAADKNVPTSIFLGHLKFLL